jgi:hypothetical protein
MLFKVAGLLTARGLAASGAALIALGGGGAVLASHQLGSSGTGTTPPPSFSVLSGDSSASPGTPRPTLAFTPGTHGQAVASAVASCKAATPSPGVHGIGQCVSKVASINGQAHRSAHSHPTPPAHPGPG